MTQFPDPRFERMRRYEPNRRPYVEVREADQRYHAQVIGWNNEEVLIQFPATVLEKVSTAEHVMKWVGTENAQRIRRADSIWASAEDDLQWHATKDHRITYRADPWTVYTQELPPVNIHSLDGSSAPMIGKSP